MYKVGAITEARMREYDEMCLSNPKTARGYSCGFGCSLSLKRGSISMKIKLITESTAKKPISTLYGFSIFISPQTPVRQRRK
jgi:hypothetical protein